MFERYPKKRPPLSPDFEAIVKTYYKKNLQGGTPASSLAKKMESWLHFQVAKDLKGRAGPVDTLEIGAGTLTQLPYEPQAGPYDIVEPSRSYYEDSKLLGRIRKVYADIGEVPEANRYDRITSVAAFEHLTDLPLVVAKSGLLLKPDGCLRVSIPSEGTPLWTLGWMLTTGLEFKLKYGQDYGLLVDHEHINTAREIEEVLRYFFGGVRCSVFGLARAVSFYQFFDCRKPDSQRCRRYLQERAARPAQA